MAVLRGKHEGLDLDERVCKEEKNEYY